MAATPRFDYAQTKAMYMSLVQNTFDEHSTHSESTISNTIDVIKRDNKTYLHKYYEVSRWDGREILVVKKKAPASSCIQAVNSRVQVLSFENIFDIFLRHHLESKHRCDLQYLRETARKLETSYQFPFMCLSLLVKSCNVCMSKPREISKGPNKTASVFVTVMLQKKQNHEKHFRYLLIYIDKATDYVLLRPLQKRVNLEVATEIFKILMQFGPPKKLRLYGYDKEFNMKVGILLRDICPKIHFTIEYMPENFEPSAIVVDKLQEWMDFNGSDSWELGCNIVQRDLNMKFKQKLKKGDEEFSPHDLLFGKVNMNKELIEHRHTFFVDPAQEYDTKDLANDHEETQSNNLEITRNLETNIDSNVIEVRIPSPENFNHNLLDELEGNLLNKEFKSLLNDFKDETKIKEENEHEIKMEDITNNILDIIYKIKD